jgi:hypothetical protein
MASLNGRLQRLESVIAPPRRPATVADIVLATDGRRDAERLDLAAFAETLTTGTDRLAWKFRNLAERLISMQPIPAPDDLTAAERLCWDALHEAAAVTQEPGDAWWEAFGQALGRRLLHHPDTLLRCRAITATFAETDPEIRCGPLAPRRADGGTNG